MHYVAHIAQSIGKADVLTSNLPPNASKTKHFLNNVVSRPDTRLLHIGNCISYSLWGHDKLRAHWIDDDFEHAPPRPDVYPYTVVTIDAHKLRAGILRHHAESLANEFIFCVDGWNSQEIRRGVDRELNRLDKWELLTRVEVHDTNNINGWEYGLGVFALGSKVRKVKQEQPKRSKVRS
jgi:hypothetical protein